MPVSMGSLGDDRVITDAIGSGLLSAGGLLAATGVGALPGAIVAAVGALTKLIGGLFAPDLTKIQATSIVNGVAAQLDQLLGNWHALSVAQKTPTMQAAYLEVVDGAFNKVQQGCSNPALGTAGQHCISERLVRGGTAPWCPNPGHTGCDWYVLYRNPIAEDPDVAANVAASQAAANAPAAQPTDTSTPGSAGGSNTSSASGSTTVSSSSMFLYGGLALVGIALLFMLGGGD
jgi:hypothetical protein